MTFMKNDLQKLKILALFFITIIFVFLGQLFLYHPLFIPKVLYPLSENLKKIKLFNLKNENIAIILFLFSSIFFFILLKISKSNEIITVNKLFEFVYLIILIIIATLIRVYKLDQIPYGFFHDETASGYAAKELMNKDTVFGVRLPIYGGYFLASNMTGFLYVMAALFKLFGANEFNLRLTYAIVGILSIPAIYFLVRSLFGVLPAIFSSFFLNFIFEHILFSRVACFAMYSGFILIIIMYFLYRCYKFGNWLDYIILSIALGFSLYTYSTSKFIFIGITILIPFFIFSIIKNKLDYKVILVKVAISLVIFIILILPIIKHELKRPGELLSRFEVVKITNPHNIKWIKGVYGEKMTPFSYFWFKIEKQLLMFSKEGGRGSVFNIPFKPVLDFTTGIFYVVGLIFLIINILKPESILVFTFFIISMLPAATTVGEEVDPARSIMLYPLFAIIAGLGAYKIFEIINSNFSKKIKNLMILIYVLLGFIIANDNIKAFFVDYERTSWGMVDIVDDQMGRDLLKFKKEVKRIAQPFCVPSGNVDFYLLPEPGYENFVTYKHFFLPSDTNTDVVFAFRGEYHYVLPSLKYIYPGGEYKEFRHKYRNDLIYFSYYIPKEIILSAQEKIKKHGLKAKFFDQNRNLLFETIEPFIFRKFIISKKNEIIGEWEGKIKIDETGDYEFIVETDGLFSLEINGKKIDFNNDPNSGFITIAKTINLKKGFHKFKAVYTYTKGFFNVNLFWKKPGDKERELVPVYNFYRE